MNKTPKADQVRALREARAERVQNLHRLAKANRPAARSTRKSLMEERPQKLEKAVKPKKGKKNV